MPQVPYRPVPDVAPSNQGTPEARVPVNIDAFGGGVASAIRSVGSEVDHAGNEIYARAKSLQELQNESVVRDAEAEYIIASGDLRAKYHSTEGRNAVEGLSGYIKDNRELQRQYADQMPNPQARRLFERSTRSQMARSVFSGAGHAAQQNRQWVQKADEATVVANEADVYNNPSPDTFERGIANVHRTAQSLEASQGWDPAVTKTWIQEHESRLVAQRIKGLARTDPVAAKAFYEQHKERLTPQADVVAQTAVENNLYRVEANRIASEVAGQVPAPGERGMTRREALDAAEAKAKEISDDPRFIQFVRDRTGAVVSQRDRVRTDDARNDMYRIGTVLTGGIDGKIPTSVDEMLALDPSLQENWDRATPSDRQRVMNQLKTNAKGDYAWDPAGNGIRRWNYLKGLATSDPTTFLNVDISNEKMPFSARRELLNLQQQVQKNPEGNPQVTKYYNMLKDSMYPAMQAAGVLPDNPQRYNEFRGALQDAIVAWRQNNNKQPTLKDLQEIARGLFRETGGNPPPTSGARGAFQSIFSPWSFGSSAVPVHRMEPPDNVMQAWRNLPRFKDKSPTTAEEVDFKREWRRREYQRLFGGSVSSGQP